MKKVISLFLLLSILLFVNRLNFLEQEGFDVTYLAPNKDGIVTVSEIEQALREDTRLVSVMTVNNETGARFPIEEIAALLKDKANLFPYRCRSSLCSRSFNGGWN